MGLDKFERQASFFLGAIAFVLAGAMSPHLFKNTKVTDTAKPSKAGTCAPHYHHVSNVLCSWTHYATPSAYLPQFIEILVIGIAIIVFALRRKRAGVAVSALLLGLALGTVGLPFVFLGGWLVIRAFRLQKYGDATFAGSSRRAREMGQERRAGRQSVPRGQKRSKSTKSKSAVTAAAGPAPSKRYTPKKATRRK